MMAAGQSGEDDLTFPKLNEASKLHTDMLSRVFFVPLDTTMRIPWRLTIDETIWS
jgi:hypothetical protein